MQVTASFLSLLSISLCINNTETHFVVITLLYGSLSLSCNFLELPNVTAAVITANCYWKSFLIRLFLASCFFLATDDPATVVTANH